MVTDARCPHCSQGDGVLDGRDFLQKATGFAETLAACGWRDVWRSVNDHQYIALTSSVSECSQMLVAPNCMTGAPRQFECLQALNQKHALSHRCGRWAMHGACRA